MPSLKHLFLAQKLTTLSMVTSLTALLIAPQRGV